MLYIFRNRLLCKQLHCLYRPTVLYTTLGDLGRQSATSKFALEEINKFLSTYPLFHSNRSKKQNKTI